jgi:hypothetical protein
MRFFSPLRFIKPASSLVTAILVIACSALADGQSLEAKLKQPVDSFDSQSDSTCGQLIDLAQGFLLPMGIEWVDEPSVRTARSIHVRNATVEDALHQILTQQTGYTFGLSDGVVHVFNRSVIDDPHNFLNIRFPEFGYKDQSLSVGSYWLRVRITALLHPAQGYGGGYGGLSEPRDFDLPRITFAGHNLTVRQILSNMARAEGNALWVVVMNRNRLMKDEPYYAPMTWYKGGEVSSDFGWQFIPLQPHAFDELTFAKGFVEQLTKAGLNVLRVGRSVMEGRFSKNYDAALIITDKGSADAIFFADSTKVSRIRVTDLGRKQNSHYEYLIENPPEREQRWETAQEHYFTKFGNVFLITRDRPLDAEFKRLAVSSAATPSPTAVP